MPNARARIFVVTLTLLGGLLAPVVAGSSLSPAAAATTPVVTKVGPGAGPLKPKTLTIRGTGLRQVKAVRFGSQPARIVKGGSGKAVKVRTPRAQRPGTVQVRVRTADGWSEPTKRSRYTFLARPRLLSLSPNRGTFAGGQRVVLRGKSLARAKVVKFGSEKARIVRRQGNKIVVRTPIGVIGRTQVRVRTVGGTSKAGSAFFSYEAPVAEDTMVLDAAAGTYVADVVDWVTGGPQGETLLSPWVVGLPRGVEAPIVGQPFLLNPGGAAFPSGLAGEVSEIAAQVDESLRVTVEPTDLEQSLARLSLDYSGPVIDPDLAGRSSVEIGGPAAQFSISGPTALFCEDDEGQQVSFGGDLSMTVTDVDVSQHLDLGSVFRRPSYDGALTAELQTTGKLTVAAAATCKIKPAWQNAQRRVIPLGTSGATVSFGPTLEFSVSGKGTWKIEDRTRTTFAVNATLGETPRYSRTTRNVESSQGGALTFEIGVTGGVQVQVGILDRAGLQGKIQIGVTVAVEATGDNVCVDGTIFAKLSIGVFLDAWVARWEADVFSVTLTIRAVHLCVVSDEPVEEDEPEITSTRMPDAERGTPYRQYLETADGRDGTWSVVRDGLPPGLDLDPATGEISGTPTGSVGDHPVVVDFTDVDGRSATTTIRIQVLPDPGIGGGDIQATLRWTGPADLDLHMIDADGEHIYYGDTVSSSGGQLDHDANAGCNGPEDDDNAVENIFWPTGAAPAGSYTVYVVVYAVCEGPLDWGLSVRRNGRVIIDETGEGASEAYEFTLGSGARVRVVPVPPAASGPGAVKR